MKGVLYLLALSFSYASATYCYRDYDCQHQYGDNAGCCTHGYCSECGNGYLLTELIGGAISLCLTVIVLVIIACCCCAGCPIHKRRFPAHPSYQITAPNSHTSTQTGNSPAPDVFATPGASVTGVTVQPPPYPAYYLPPPYSESSLYPPADGQRGYDNKSFTLPTYEDAVKNSKQYVSADGGETSSPRFEHQMVAPEAREAAQGGGT